MKLIHNWKTTSGLNVTAICELTLTEKVYADGHSVEVSACKQSFKIKVAGMGIIGTHITHKSQSFAGVSYPATCGKLVISQENLDAIDAMTKKIEETPEWIKKTEQEDQSRKESAEYEKHSAMMKKAMSY